jgi:hypothetical protein
MENATSQALYEIQMSVFCSGASACRLLILPVEGEVQHNT